MPNVSSDGSVQQGELQVKCASDQSLRVRSSVEIVLLLFHKNENRTNESWKANEWNYYSSSSSIARFFPRK